MTEKNFHYINLTSVTLNFASITIPLFSQKQEVAFRVQWTPIKTQLLHWCLRNETMSQEKTNLYDLSSQLAMCIPPQAQIVQSIIIRLNLMDCLWAALKIKQTTAYLNLPASSIFVKSKDIGNDYTYSLKFRLYFLQSIVLTLEWFPYPRLIALPATRIGQTKNDLLACLVDCDAGSV